MVQNGLLEAVDTVNRTQNMVQPACQVSKPEKP